MSKFLRLELDRLLDRRYELMVSLQEELRELAKKKVPSQIERERKLWMVLEDEKIWTTLESDPGKAREMAMKVLVS